MLQLDYLVGRVLIDVKCLQKIIISIPDRGRSLRGFVKDAGAFVEFANFICFYLFHRC